MTAITREYLDTLENADLPYHEARNLIAALRHVLDALDALEESGDYNPYPALRDALAGTQTDDGAGEKSSDLHGDKAPSAAPSSPDLTDQDEPGHGEPT